MSHATVLQDSHCPPVGMAPLDKIVSLDKLAELARHYRQHQQRIVLCHGTFDLMHIGHIRYLQRARQQGDVLLVTITADGFVNKGPDRPIFNQQLRAENLAALECVDGVAINEAITAVNVIHQLQPDVYAKGSEYQNADDDLTGNITLEQQAVESHQGRVFFVDDIRFSSSHLLNQHFEVFPPPTAAFLDGFRRRYSTDSIIEHMGRLKTMNVLVAGEAIIDEYHYCTPMGQTGKGNTLAVKYASQERFAGGSIAVANHIAGFVDSVTLLCALGRDDSNEEFIRSKLAANITPKFFYTDDAPTLVKRRYTTHDLAKLFEVYYCNDAPLADPLNRVIVKWLQQHLPDFDCVTVPDFGNGFISPEMATVFAEQARFLAVNTQINSGNRGYHVIQRYPKADFISLNEPELRLAAHDRHGPIKDLALSLGNQLHAKQIAITQGTEGLQVIDVNQRHVTHVPALSTKVVDRIGAGDAFLSLAGIALAGHLPTDMAAFIGSAAAALDVQIVCNREPVNPTSLFKTITTLMK